MNKEEYTTLSSVKILIACHAPCALLKDSVFVPIHVGRKLAEQAMRCGRISEEDIEWLNGNMIGDDTGDNISNKNKQYCELTPMYWAWKNYDDLGDPDYIGFMHYRRHLCFDLKNQTAPNKFGTIDCPRMDEGYINMYHLHGDQVREVVTGYDIVVAEKLHVNFMNVKTVFDQYKNSPHHNIEDYKTVLATVKKNYPDFSESVDEYNSQPYGYFTNIFVMRRGLFSQYAEWLFSILGEAEKKINLTNRTEQEARALAYIAERLFGIWLSKIRKTGIRILELKRTKVLNTACTHLPNVSPAFTDHNVAICFSTNQQYLPYLCTCVRSIVSHSDIRNNYDINILHNSIPLHMQKEVKRMQGRNVRIRFWSVSHEVDKNRERFFISDHITQETYYRILIPEVFSKYKKLLYIDCDLIFLRDAASLYSTKLGENHWVAAAHDPYMKCKVYMKDSYACRELKMKNPINYFQAGVLLFNISALRDVEFTKKALSELSCTKMPKFWDQDILNILCEGHVFFLDMKWNVEWHIPRSSSRDYPNLASSSEKDEYEEAYNNPWVLHYCGEFKPWKDPSLPQSSYFWEYARDTPFYEKIIYDNLTIKLPIKDASTKVTPPAQPDYNAVISPVKRDTQEIKVALRGLSELPTLRRKLRVVRFRLLFTIGNRRSKLKARKRDLKARIRGIMSSLLLK